MKQETIRFFLENSGQRYSEVLGININNGNDEEILKWFLASILFGAPITATSVIKTYRCFRNTAF